MKMKSNGPFALLVAAGTLLITTAPLLFAAHETDDRIVAAAKNSHVFKTHLKGDSIKTESKEGVVTLTGTVAEASHKSLAQDTVESLPGVVSVDNRLKTKGEPPPEHSDGWVGTKVKSTLWFHRSVSAARTKVDVKDGIVTLTGEASSLAQKELTTEYAQDVEGVNEVRNEMTVASKPAIDERTDGQKIDDASITAQVKAALRSHRSTSALKTKVTTNNGAVTVSGIAKNEAEKRLVTKLVTDIDGVVSVINDMTLAVPVVAKD